MGPSNLVLLTFYLLYVAEGKVKSNPNVSSHLLVKFNRGKAGSSLLAGKITNRNDTYIKNSTTEGKLGRQMLVVREKNDRNTNGKARKGSKHIFKNRLTLKMGVRNNSRFQEKQVTRKSKKGKHYRTRPEQPIVQGKRKSQIDIQGQMLKSPVWHTSQDGTGQYLTIRTNDYQQATPINPNIPSKTFLVTVFGDQIEGAKEKIYQVLTDPQPKKCPCKCEDDTPCKQTEEDCSCDEVHTNQAVSLQAGGKKLVLFPNAGCVCPCCLCSCSEPGYENYHCGCQDTPPSPCPCSDVTMNSGSQPQILPYPSPAYARTNLDNQVASWTEGTSHCSCSCCPCACTQPQMYPNYQCGCASQSPTPCPCSNQEWNSDQSGAQSQQSSPNTALVPMSNVAQSTGNSPYIWTTNDNFPPPNYADSGPVTKTFRSGDYLFESSCDCYCCPCSCPGSDFSNYDNSQCDCALDNDCSCSNMYSNPVPNANPGPNISNPNPNVNPNANSNSNLYSNPNSHPNPNPNQNPIPYPNTNSITNPNANSKANPNAKPNTNVRKNIISFH